MLVAVFTTFAADRKEPFGYAVERVHAAFVAAGFGEPKVQFSLSDALSGDVSSVERVLKHWPALTPFARAMAGPTAARRSLSNVTGAGAVAPVDFAVLSEIARGVPKSFPAHQMTVHFSAPNFSQGPELPATADPRTLGQLLRAGVDIGAGQPTTAGVSVKDSWGANGRLRFLSALRIVAADASLKALPAPPADVAAVFAACGKVEKTQQLPLAGATPAQTGAADGILATPVGEAIRAKVRAYRARLPELLAALPHDLPLRSEEPPASGPKKPDLLRAFEPLGYDCHGKSGSFTLRRRTAGHLAVELALDVGTWGNAILAHMKVLGLVDGQGFKATLPLPVSAHGPHGQFPIGGAERWGRIVDNLAALVAALDRSFVPEIESVAGPSPEWFRPESV
jgi:hypothetical protein